MRQCRQYRTSAPNVPEYLVLTLGTVTRAANKTAVVAVADAGFLPKEIVMLPKTMAILALTTVLFGSALPSSAFAHGVRCGGDNGLRGDTSRRNHISSTFGDWRLLGEGYSDNAGCVGGLRSKVYGYRGRDVWGHWGAYYGPMISNP
jgi:hypothetical protein